MGQGMNLLCVYFLFNGFLIAKELDESVSFSILFFLCYSYFKGIGQGML